jgi:FkbM family methyltransferase
MSMARTTLKDGTKVFCIHRNEAKVLDDHVLGYLAHGIQVNPGDVVFDVGANIGLFGVRLNQRCAGELRLFAFEPIPQIHAVAQANLNAWAGSTVYRCGVSREPGETRFMYYPNTPSLSTAHPDMWADAEGELEEAVWGNAQHAPMWYAKLMPRFLAGFMARRLRKDAQEVVCPLKTVSEVVAEHGLDRIDLLKVDCEGAELDVLRGIDEADWPKVQQAVLEVHDVDGQLEAIEGLLRDHGLTEQVREKEPAFVNTRLSNVFARRPNA